MGTTLNLGTVFKLTPSGTLSDIHYFDSFHGYSPKTPVVIDGDGNIFGTATNAIFRIDASGVYSVLREFEGGADGKPISGLTLADDGLLYGGTDGGPNGYGTIFKIAKNGNLNSLKELDVNTGSPPIRQMTIGQNGDLYGTLDGGEGGVGTAFRITRSTGTFTRIALFDCMTIGCRPSTPLTLGLDGFLYGATSFGGAQGNGTVFKMSGDGVMSLVYSFAESRDRIDGKLLAARDGNFYGTRYGEASGDGRVFRVTPQGQYSIVASIDGATQGRIPLAGLAEGPNGRLFTTMSSGGTFNYGTVVSFDAPAAIPSNVTGVFGSNSVELRWSVSPAATTYNIYQSTRLGEKSRSLIASGITDTHYRVTGLADCTPYYFTITAVNDLGETQPSAEFAIGEAVTDGSPSDFNFIFRSRVPQSRFITSESVTIAGFDGSLPIQVSGGSAQYRIGSGSFRSDACVIGSGQSLTVRHISADRANASVTSEVRVGNFRTPFSSTTAAEDRVPDTFDFGVKFNQAPGTPIESDTVPISGIDAAATIIPGPGLSYRINGTGEYMENRGVLMPGQSLQVRHTSNSKSLGYSKTYLRVGGVTGYFTTRTKK